MQWKFDLVAVGVIYRFYKFIYESPISPISYLFLQSPEKLSFGPPFAFSSNFSDQEFYFQWTCFFTKIQILDRISTDLVPLKYRKFWALVMISWFKFICIRVMFGNLHKNPFKSTNIQMSFQTINHFLIYFFRTLSIYFSFDN